MPEPTAYVHRISAVVPVYQGEKTLGALVEELAAVNSVGATPGGRAFRIVEIILVHDCGPDDSARIMRELAERMPSVRAIWLSRNFGQHAATMAGIASSVGDWVVTLDEDGQHDPADIPRLLDVALDARVPLVYARSTNAAPHAWYRNVASASAKFIANRVLISGGIGDYSSFRLILGEDARSLAAYTGHGVYLDAAMWWIVPKSATCDVELRDEGQRSSGYRLRSLGSHFWRLVLTSGTRPLRMVAVAGAVAALMGVVLAVVAVQQRLTDNVPIEGWTSVIVVSLLGFGVLLLSLGIVAEYVGVAVRMAMGRPPFLVVSDPSLGPLGAAAATPHAVTGHDASA